MKSLTNNILTLLSMALRIHQVHVPGSMATYTLQFLHFVFHHFLRSALLSLSSNVLEFIQKEGSPHR